MSRSVYLKLLVAFFIVFQSVTIGSEVKLLPSMEWQKQHLSQLIEKKVRNTVGSILTSDQYNVSVEIEAKKASEPDFYDSQKPPLNDINLAGGKKKAVINNSKDEANKKLEEELSKNSIKFDNAELDEEKEDVVTFSKFGIEAPLIDDFQDFQPDGKIVLAMENKSEKDAIKRKEEEFKNREQKLKDQINKLRNEAGVSPIEQIWKYNNSVDIFKNLKSVKIEVQLSSQIQADVKEAVKAAVKAIPFNIGKVKPTIQFKDMLLKAEVPQSPKELIKEALGYIGAISPIVAILLGGILLWMLSKSLMSKYFELSAGQGGSNQTIKMENNAKEEDEDEKAGAEPMAMGGGGEAGTNSDEVCGVERFSSFFKTSPSEAIVMLKTWLASETNPDSQKALRALVQQMDNQSLSGVFKVLSEREKAAWKNMIDRPLNSQELIEANKVISKEVVQKIIVPSMITDAETYDLLVRLKSTQVTEVIKENPQVTNILLNVLSPEYLSRVLEEFDEDKREEALEAAMKSTKDEIIAGQDLIKETLKNYVESHDILPFVDKAIEMLPNVSSQIEVHLYEQLIRMTSVDRVKELGLLNYPSFLVHSFSDQVVKTLVADYPLDDKVKLLMVVDESLKEKLMNIYAPAGTKANDLLTIEFESYSNEDDKNKLMMEKTDIEKKYVDYVRKRVQKEKEIMSEADGILDSWIQQNLGEGDKPHLQAVA